MVSGWGVSGQNGNIHKFEEGLMKATVGHYDHVLCNKKLGGFPGFNKLIH